MRMFASTQVSLVEMVATAKKMLLPTRWSDVAVAGGKAIVLRVVLSAVNTFLLSCFSGPLSTVHKVI